MTEQEQPTEESWDGLIDTWLKAKHFKQFPDRIFVQSVKAGLNRRGDAQLVAKVQYQGKKYLWDINKTNMRKLEKLGITKPKDLTAKSISLNKIRVRNPSTQEMVDSLEVEKLG